MIGREPLTEEDLERFCEIDRVDATLHRLTVPTPTVADAAAAVGADPGRIVKSLVFLAEREPLLVIAAGESRVAYPMLAEFLGISRKRLRFATADEALAVTGYRVGAMPPFGHRIQLPTLIDANTVPDAGTVFAGGGGVSSLLELDARDLHEVTSAKRVALSRG
ncbi:MAG TPA: YbaK/EbsC family protein [Trueperaceae bacterium]